MKKTINLTKAGKEKLEAELAELKAERPAITERIATARAFGDLSENEEYSSARAEQKLAETRIQEIEEVLKNAKIIRARTSNKVTMGSTVTVKIGNKKQTFTIVGPVEANPLEGRISNESPIGAALIGRKVDEEYPLPNGKTGKVVEIS